jgi:hypothetical protein
MVIVFWLRSVRSAQPEDEVDGLGQLLLAQRDHQHAQEHFGPFSVGLDPLYGDPVRELTAALIGVSAGHSTSGAVGLRKRGAIRRLTSMSGAGWAGRGCGRSWLMYLPPLRIARPAH